MGYMNLQPRTLSQHFSNPHFPTRHDLVVQDGISLAAQQKFRRRMALNCRQRRAGNVVDGSEGSGQLKNTKLPDVAKIPQFRADFAGQQPDVILWMGVINVSLLGAISGAIAYWPPLPQ